MKKIRDSFLTALGLICRVPFGLKYDMNFSLFPFFFPIIGLIVSGVVLGVFFVLNPLFTSTGITAFIILLVQYAAFNLFHFDGLLDSADAFFFNTNRKRRLEILTDKRLGSFAIFAGSLYLFFKLYLLNEIISILNLSGFGWVWLIILFSYPLSGRISGALMPVFIPPAEDPGLAELLGDYSPLLMAAGIILSLAVPLVIVFSILSTSVNIIPIVLPFSGAFIAGIIVSAVSRGFVGGYTGDSIGLSIEIGEIMHLMIIIEVLGRLF